MTKEAFIGIVVFGIVAVIAGGVFLITPALTPDSIAHRTEADRYIARAERALASFSQGFAEVEAAEQQLAALGVPANVGEIDDLEAAINAGDLVGEASNIIRQMGGAVVSQNARVPADREDKWLELGYSPGLVSSWFVSMAAFGKSEQERKERIGAEVVPPSWADGGSPSASKIKALWQALVNERKKNAALLNEAESAAREALNVSPGDLRASRVLGMTLLQRARLAQRDAMIHAALASPMRRRAIELAGQVRELAEAEADYNDRRKLQDAIDQAQAEREEIAAQLAAATTERDRLAGELRDLQARVADALAEVRSTREALDALTLSGYEAERHGPFAAYVNSVKASSESWRQKSVTYQALLEGTVDGGETRLGVGPLERDLALAEKRLELLTVRLQEADADVEALKSLHGALDEASAKRRRQIDAVRSELQAVVDAEGRVSAEARALEEAAADKHVEAALRQFANARNAAVDWTRPGDETEVDPEISSKQQQDGWMEAMVHADQAVGLLLIMSVQLQRIADLNDRLPMVSAAADAGIREMQPGTIEEQINLARRAGLDAYERSQKHIEDAQRRDDQWYFETLTGSAQFAKYLLDPDDPASAETLEAAMQAFRDAVNGREDSRYAVPYLRVLETMQTAASAG